MAEADHEGPTLRPATNADAADIRRLVFGILREYGLHPDPGGTDADLDDLERTYGAGGRFDVLVDGAGRIVGTVGLMRIDDEEVELRKMYLAPAARGHGQGRRLLEHAITAARELGYVRMVLETASVLREAIGLYASYGFAPGGAARCSQRCDRIMVRDLHVPMTTPRLRAARAADAPALARLAATLGYTVTERSMSERLQERLDAGDLVVVATGADGSVLAWLHAAVRASLESGAVAEIVGLVVREDVRRRGLARRLVARASRWSRARGVARLRVRSRIERDDAHRFYAALGFDAMKTQTVFERAIGDEDDPAVPGGG